MRTAGLLFLAFFITACSGSNSANTSQLNGANANVATDRDQVLKVVERPQKIKDLMASRGEQDSAMPKLKILEPSANSVIASSTVKVKLEISGDLKGYMPGMNEETHTGNHIHVILDDQPYEAYYDIGRAFELRNVSDGEHTIRVFPSRPWHESYKNDGAFQMVKFTVKGGGADATKPATADGKTMSNANTSPTPEGKDMKASTAGAVDPSKPLLTYSRPKGEYKSDDANVIMIDFWLANAKLVDDGGKYRVRYSVDGFKSNFITKWEPIWLTGWPAGKYSIKLELTDSEGNLVDNGGYNSTTREITITR
ncbi:MAG: hypothetical protein KF736_03715 [Acidobacteria bacterium]|nr:hypothetical protein [Acidobacteriota bacterium]MCW5948508.1 hypothetical protein [Pyrinomonadaceae bacterium]